MFIHVFGHKFQEEADGSGASATPLSREGIKSSLPHKSKMLNFIVVLNYLLNVFVLIFPCTKMLVKTGRIGALTGQNTSRKQEPKQLVHICLNM